MLCDEPIRRQDPRTRHTSGRDGAGVKQGADVRTGIRSPARLAIGAAFVVHGAISGSWATTIPWVKEDLRLGAGALGLALLGHALGAVLVMPLAGAVIAQRGSRVVTRAMLVLDAGALALTVVAPALWALFPMLMFFGGAGGAMDVAMNAQGVALERLAGRPILSSFHALWSVGGFAGALLGAGAARIGLSPTLHIPLICVALITGGLLATRRLLPGDLDRSQEGPRFVWPRGTLALLGVVAFCAMLAEGAALDWSGVYLRVALGADATIAAIAVASFSLGMAIGRFVGDALVLRFGPVAFVRAAGIVALSGLAIAVLGGVPSLGVVGFALLGLGLSSIVPVVLSRAGRISGIGAPGIAAVTWMGYTAFVVGPSLVGGVAEFTELRIALAVVLGLIACIPVLAARVED